MTKTGGRVATVRHIAGDCALSVGMPRTTPPSGWRWVALTDIARLESGHTPSRRHLEYWSGEIPWLSIRDAKAHHGETIFDTIETINKLGIENSSARILPKGTVCLSRTASVGYVTIMGRAMATSQDFVNWVCSERLDPRFLQYLLICEKPSLSRFSSGAVHQTIYFPEVKAFHVCLPPIEEQRRIVAVLDAAFAAIATVTSNAEKNIANARELFEHASSELLTEGGDDWREHALDEVCTISSKLVDPRLDEFIDMPHIGAGNVESRTGELSKVLTAREEGLISGKFLFDPTMVLYSKIRPYLMKACRPDFAGLCSADVYPLVPIEGKLDRNFLFQILLSRGFTAYAEAGSARAGMPKVNRDHLFAYRIKLPPIEKQRELAEKIDALADDCRNLTGCFEAKLSALASLKQSLLHRAFSGTLTATVPLATNDNWKTPSFAAQVIGLAYRRHLARGTEATFGRVKAQKALHLCESVGMVDMGRNPIKDAAGPNDFQHMLAAEDWAKANEFFEFVQRPSGNGYSFRKLPLFDAMIADGAAALKPVQVLLERAIALITPMNSEEAELLATVHAAWNNLILDGVEPIEGAIIREARENWHASKLKFSDGKFREAIATIRAKGIVPDGSAKRVGGQEALAF